MEVLGIIQQRTAVRALVQSMPGADSNFTPHQLPLIRLHKKKARSCLTDTKLLGFSVEHSALHR